MILYSSNLYENQKAIYQYSIYLYNTTTNIISNDFGVDLTFLQFELDDNKQIHFYCNNQYFKECDYFFIKKDLSNIDNINITHVDNINTNFYITPNLDNNTDYYFFIYFNYTKTTGTYSYIKEYNEQSNISIIFPNKLSNLYANYTYFIFYKKSNIPPLYLDDLNNNKNVVFIANGKESYCQKAKNNDYCYNINTTYFNNEMFIKTNNELPPSPPITDSNFFFKIYKPSLSILNQLTSKMYVQRTSTEGLVTYDYYGDRVLNAGKCFFNLGNSIKDENIKLGKLDTNILCPRLKNDLNYVFETETILIKGYYNNYLDYNSSVIISIKYCGITNRISVNDILNKEIKFKYVINLYDGSLTCILLDKDNNYIKSFDGYCIDKYPYIYNQFESPKYLYNDIDLSISLYIGDVVNDVYNVDLYSKITNQTYIKIDEIVKLENINSFKEYELIFNILSKGIYI